MKPKTLCYILDEFPSRTETFILREIDYISRENTLYIVALKRGEWMSNYEIYRKLENRIIYVPSFLSYKQWKCYFNRAALTMLYDQTVVLCKKFLRKKNFGFLAKEMKYLLIGIYLNQKLNQYPIQHIHAHFAGYPASIAMKISELMNIPFSFTAHAHDIYVEKNQLEEKIQKATLVVTCTQYNKKYLQTLLSPDQHKKIHVIYHGIDIQVWKYKIPNSYFSVPIKILTVARLVEKKGLLYLLKTIQLLKENGEKVRLVIIGKGKEYGTLRKYCIENELDESVSFEGWKTPDEVMQFMESSDLFILPSIVASDGDRDGLPNVLLEAMASGLPVISTNVSAIPELIKDHHNALLVPEKNAKEITKAIYALKKDENLRISVIRNARLTIVQNFNSDNSNIRLRNLFQSIGI